VQNSAFGSLPPAGEVAPRVGGCPARPDDSSARTPNTRPPTVSRTNARLPSRFGRVRQARLKRCGLTIRGGRNAALIGLAAELPAAVLTALLAIDIVTATRWAGYAKRDWTDFRAARHADAQQQPAAP
jgi:hypothetical protein